jgi:hypothetical protein
MTVSHAPDFAKQLRRHLRFIETSCRLYDGGDIDEALRIAVSLRVLFHDHNRNFSLLTHLGKKSSIRLISTIGLGQTEMQLDKNLRLALPFEFTLDGVAPPLDATRPTRLIECVDWWNEIVMVQRQGFSRWDVIRAAANQLGGAHVDGELRDKSAVLMDGIGTFNGGELIETHFPLLRQIGYEVLASPELTGLA